jgi:hypothetical protein
MEIHEQVALEEEPGPTSTPEIRTGLLARMFCASANTALS